MVNEARHGKIGFSNPNYHNPPIPETSAMEYILNAANKMKSQTEELEHKAYKDPLTGLSNRNALVEDVKKLDLQNNNCDHMAFYFDLNSLKKENDTKGHVAGDKLLKKMSNLLESVFTQDIGKAYRNTAGDEFLAILSTPNALTFSESILNTLSQKTEEINKGIGANETALSFAVGIASYDADKDDHDFYNTIERADRNMQINKTEMKAFDPSLER